MKFGPIGPYQNFTRKLDDLVANEDLCLTGNSCTHPFCPDHEVRDFWDRTDWPVLADTDPWWDGLQSQADYRHMHLYFDRRGGTL